GLPLAFEFGKKRPVIGFDINQARINALREGHGSTLEASDEELKEGSHLSCSGRRQKLSATPDLSGMVLPLCVIPNSALKNAPPFKSAVRKGSACARLLA